MASGAWASSLLLALVFVAAGIVWTVPFIVGFALAGEPVADSLARLADLTDPTPLGLAYLNLVLATAIPVSWLRDPRVCTGCKPRWLSSVRPRLRWGYLLVCLGLSVVALVAMMVVSLLLPVEADAGADGRSQRRSRAPPATSCS